MNTLIIGNIFALFGSFVMIGIGFLKKKNEILIAQCLQCALLGFGNLVLGGITGAMTNLITIIRNLITFKFPFTLPLKILFNLFFIIFGLYANTQGAWGYLPILSCVIFTWYMDLEDEISFKYVIIGTIVMWVIYDFHNQNYTGFFFDILTILSNTITLFKLKRNR